MEQTPSAVALSATAPALGEATSAVSWPAVFAGAIVALALAIVLSLLAAGFGLKLGLPWLASRASLAAFTPVLGAWMIAAQVVSNALGGYLAGRLRTKWTIHSDEAHFRDTAHGLLVWALSTVVGVALAALVLAPYAESMSGPSLTAAAAQGVDAVALATRQANIASQASFFIAVGLILSAFTAAVAAAVGGQRRDEMYGKV